MYILALENSALCKQCPDSLCRPAPESSPQPNCPAYSGPAMNAQSAVKFELRFPEPFLAPACAPGCLISLSGGDASFDALAQGYQTAGTFFASQDAMTYFGTLYVRALARCLSLFSGKLICTFFGTHYTRSCCPPHERRQFLQSNIFCYSTQVFMNITHLDIHGLTVPA